jgi:type VII secretion protein EccB
MARTPVTKVQLDAYRFGQRRMESALARRDPVLLHEEIRGQRRVVATGLALAMLALVAMFAYAKISPAPDWRHESVIAGAQSGRYFVVIHDPDRLVPVANLAAARLVLHVADPTGDGGSATARVIDDKYFDTAERTASAAVPGAQATLPSPDAPPAPAGPWAVCGTATPGGPLTSLVADAGSSTPLGPTDGSYLEGPDQVTYLVMNNVKHRIVLNAAKAAYDLLDHRPRAVGAALLALIPDGRPLDTLTITGAGRPSTTLSGHAVGEVVRVQAGQSERFYVVLPQAVAEVSRPVGTLLRAGGRADLSQPPDTVGLDAINAVSRLDVPGLSDYPSVVPRITDPEPGTAGGAVCWQWDARGLSPRVTTAATLPLKPGRTTTTLARPGQGQQGVQEVSLPAGGALVACAVSATQPRCATGANGQQSSNALWLVSETGVGYPIANQETAGALGVQSSVPVPADALRALASGPTLDVAQATRSVDVLSAGPGG